MAMKRCSTYTKPAGMKLHNLMKFSLIPRTLVVKGNLTPLLKCSQHIIQPQTTEKLSLRVRVILGEMATREYSTLPRAPKLEIHNLMLFSVISRTPFLSWSILSPLRRSESYLDSYFRLLLLCRGCSRCGLSLAYREYTNDETAFFLF